MATRMLTTDTIPSARGPTLVFLHGAGTGPWIWDRVRAHWQCESLALTYPGRQRLASPESCAEAVVAELNRLACDEIILVLHSLAGVLAGPLAMRLGRRLKRLILLSAVVPAPRRNFAQALGFPARLVLPMLFRLQSKGLKPSPGMIRSELCHDLAPEDADRIVTRYEAEFPGLYLTPPTPLPSDSPLTYIHLLQDRSVSPRVQQTMMDRLMIADRHAIDAGHLAMLSQPETLVRILRVIREKAPHSLEPEK